MPGLRTRSTISPLRSAAAILAILTIAPASARADDDEAGRVAVMADAGVPDGLMAGVMIRATPRLRLHATGGHNTMSAGLRGGVRADAFTGAVSPYVAVELGYYFAGAPQPWARSLAERAGLDDAELDRIGYRFANGHVGLRFGDRRASLFLQGGVSHVHSDLGIVEERVMETGSQVEISASTELSGWVPAGRFGFVSYF